MSSSDRISRRAALAGLALVPLLALTGCFTPMYAPPSAGAPGLGDVLATVSVDTIEGRVGQQVRNALLFGLTGGAEAPVPVYSLAVVVTSSRDSSIINAENNAPQIDQVRLTGTFVLKDIATNQVVFSGKKFALNSYDRSIQRFASLRAARDAENRAAELLAEQIKTELAVHFAGKR